MDLIDPRNLGPTVQVALLLGLGQSSLALMQSVIVVGALSVTVFAALAVDDPLESLLWATLASLVVLPVTWFHHFAVLVPFGVAALARGWAAGVRTRRRLMWLAGLAFAIGAIGFGQVFTWLMVPVFVAATRISRGRRPVSRIAGVD